MSCRIRNIFLLMLVLVAGTDLSAQKEKAGRLQRVTLNGYVKYLPSVSFQKVNENWITDNLIHNRLNLNWDINNNITFNTQARNRIYFGETVTNFQGYSDYIDTDNGFIDMSWTLFSANSIFMVTQIDRLYLDYNINKFQITVGRQRVNWGQAFVWNPNDLFNTYSFFDFDYEEKPGSDAVRVQFYNTYSSKFDVVAKLDHNKKVTFAGLYRFNKWQADIQFLGGYYAGTDFTLGAGFSASVLKGGLRGEVTCFHPQNNFSDTTTTFVASLGYDYTFKNSLMILVEGLYNGYGYKSGGFDLKEFYFMNLSPKNLSLTRWSFLSQLSYPITPLFKGTLAAMYSPNDNSWFVGPSAEYSLTESLYLNFFVQYFTSDTPVEQGGRGCFLFWRFKWSF
jgi:hypothetical protein